MKRMAKRWPVAGVVVAGLILAGCSDDDNLDDFESYPSFPLIATDGADADRRANAELSGAALAYQAALIYETTLNFRDFDGIQRPLGAEDTNGRHDCDIDGRVYYDRYSYNVSTAYGDGNVDEQSVVSYGCTVNDPSASSTERAVVGVLFFAQDQEVTRGSATNSISYTEFGDRSAYRVQYLTPAGAGQNDRDRVEVHGFTLDGPGTPIEVGGTDRDVQEFTQDLLVTNAIGQVSDDGKTVTDQTVVTIRYGGGSDGRFVRREIQDVGQLQLEGALGSGSTRDASCVGGRFTLDTDVNLTVAGGNITGGTLSLASGSGASAEEATLVFQANGDVLATGDDGASATLTRAALETIRTTCFQTVVAKR